MDLCIYHGGCDDGVAAAWTVDKRYPGVEMFAGVYQQSPPNVTGKDVILVDFSYKRPVLEQMAQKARSITILDHHKTAQEDLVGINGVAIEFDMSRCGCVIAWQHFFPDKEMPPMFDYIQDRDLWKKELPDCDEVIAAFRSYPQDFKTWDTLLYRHPIDLVGEGASILRNNQVQIERAKRFAHPLRINGHKVLAAHSTVHFSEIAGELSNNNEADFGAAYFLVEEAEKVVFSLRSRNDKLDVSEIAKLFGGGGHRNAAGFSIPVAKLQEFMTG